MRLKAKGKQVWSLWQHFHMLKHPKHPDLCPHNNYNNKYYNNNNS